MNHRICLRVAAAAAALNAAAPTALAAKLSAEKHASSSTTHVVLSGDIGVGQFQDIQVPVNEGTGRRGDGTPAVDENTNHTGLPMHLGLAIETRPGELWDWTIAKLDALQMSAANGSASTQGASYSRLALGTGIERQLQLGELNYSAGLRAGLRRDSFANVSTSHYIEAALVGGALGVHGAESSFEVYGQTSPWARFGYSTSTALGGHPLADSTAAVTELGGTLSFLLRPGVWLDTGLSRESARVTINDIGKYQSFGLKVLDTTSNSRAYDLETTLASLGFRKEF